jgi:hypothetical protein
MDGTSGNAVFAQHPFGIRWLTPRTPLWVFALEWIHALLEAGKRLIPPQVEPQSEGLIALCVHIGRQARIRLDEIRRVTFSSTGSFSRLSNMSAGIGSS